MFTISIQIKQCKVDLLLVKLLGLFRHVIITVNQLRYVCIVGVVVCMVGCT